MLDGHGSNSTFLIFCVYMYKVDLIPNYTKMPQITLKLLQSQPWKGCYIVDVNAAGCQSVVKGP